MGPTGGGRSKERDREGKRKTTQSPTTAAVFLLRELPIAFALLPIAPTTCTVIRIHPEVEEVPDELDMDGSTQCPSDACSIRYVVEQVQSMMLVS